MSEFENDHYWLLEISKDEKHWIYLGDETSDMSDVAINDSWGTEKSAWDEV